MHSFSFSLLLFLLQGLLKLGFKDFTRVGSLKKISKKILPFTAISKNANEGKRRQLAPNIRFSQTLIPLELRDLNSMLEDDSLTPSEKKGGLIICLVYPD